jgi:acyl-coenzyme A synthetase/AMP-(fatty) acid ligase
MTLSLLASWREHAQRQPATPALVWHGHTVSHGALSAMAHDGYAALARLELPPQSTVAVVAPKSPQTVALILAGLMARLRVLLPPVDLPATTLRHLLASADCTHVLAPAQYPGPPVTHVVNTRVHPITDRREQPATADDVQFVLTTSGSTGLPKLVPIGAGAVDRFLDWAGRRFEIRPGRSVLNYAPLNFDLCLLDVWTTLAYGGCVILVDPDRATDTGYLLGLLDRDDLHLVQAVPMLYQLLADATRAGGRHFDRPAHVIFTGDRIPEDCLAELPLLFSRARLYNVYGCTETNDSLLYEVDRSVPPRGPVPLGEPLPGVHTLLVDGDGRIVTGPGCGELYVATPFQTEGYLGNARLNDAKFVAHPQGRAGVRYFRSGDLVRRRPDGSLRLKGRCDFRIKVRGVQVDTQHVEHVLQTCPHVAEAAVVSVPDPLAGHRLHAVVRRTPAAGLNSLAVRRHCAQHLPRAAIPSTIRIVEDPLPRTSTGKVDRNQIKHRQPKER